MYESSYWNISNTGTKYYRKQERLSGFSGTIYPSTTTTVGSKVINSTLKHLNLDIGNNTNVIPTTTAVLSKCSQPRQNVAFLKVHKASSTTVMNIFLRYGDSNSLNIVLPKTRKQNYFNYLGYGTTVQKSRINKIPTNETYNILCNHVVYNRDVFRELLGPNSINIGIVRDPFTHFPSAASYYGLLNHLSIRIGRGVAASDLLSLYLKSPKTFGKSPHVHNGMFSDFGLPVSKYDNELAINQYLEKIDREFSLILVTELFDESLVLMKRTLCWEIKDILYVPLNINKKKEKNPIVLSEDAKKDLFAYNYADFKLYIFAKERLLKRIAHEENLMTEVTEFKRINGIVSEFCHKCKKSNFKTNDYIEINESTWNSKFTMYPKDCKFMMSPELQLLTTLMAKANRKYHNWLKSQGNRRHVVA